MRAWRLRAAALSVALLLLLSPALAAACTLMQVTRGGDLVVYFTKFVEEDKTGGRYKKCKIVTKRRADTKTFRVTPFRQDATVVVHRSNWP